jgi:hypothetical protein
MMLEGGFFLRKKPLSGMDSVYTNSEKAIAPEGTQTVAAIVNHTSSSSNKSLPSVTG